RALHPFPTRRSSDLEVDLSYECGRLTPAAVEALDALEPFGMKNPKPRVAVTGGWVRRVFILKERHVKLLVTGRHGETECLMWNAIGTPLGDQLAQCEGRYVDLYGTPRIDSYGGRRRATLAIEDAILGRFLDEEAA